MSVDQSTGSVTVRAIFQNKDAVLLPGMFVRARIDEGSNDHALIVPQIGVTHDQKGQPTALVVGPDNKVALVNLVTSGTYGSNWVVDSGLKAGDRGDRAGHGKSAPGRNGQGGGRPTDAGRFRRRGFCRIRRLNHRRH